MYLKKKIFNGIFIIVFFTGCGSSKQAERVDYKTKDSNCKEANTGDYCFQNNTNFPLAVTLYLDHIPVASLTLQKGQTQCFYNFKVGAANYDIGRPAGNYHFNSNDKPYYSANGQIYVEQCKTKTFIIK